jgi:hypothetical protein
MFCGGRINITNNMQMRIMDNRLIASIPIEDICE